MPIVLGVDLGTTKITSLAVDAASGTIVATAAVANEANITSDHDRVLGHSEWDVDRITAAGYRCLAEVAKKIGSRAGEIVGMGVTGQQHGMLLADADRRPISPLINWQDRRALQLMPNRNTSWLAAARAALGPDAWQRTGCHLHPGFMAVTLFEMATRGTLPANSRALFIMDHFTASLTGETPVSEPSCAGSSGVFNVHTRD
jgi:xylulokinase